MGKNSYMNIYLCNNVHLYVHVIIDPDKPSLSIKLWIYSYLSVLTCVLSALKNLLIETIILSTNSKDNLFLSIGFYICFAYSKEPSFEYPQHIFQH